MRRPKEKDRKQEKYLEVFYICPESRVFVKAFQQCYVLG